MTQQSCNLVGSREDALVGYIYGELDPAEQRAFELHLAACRTCSEEVAELEAVRSGLGQWGPPERVLTKGTWGIVPAGIGAARHPRTSSRWWREVPAWAQVAAAMLVVGVAASVANLDINYGRDGLSVHTGWLRAAPPAGRSLVQDGGREVIAASSPWHSDLVALEQQLRKELQPPGVAGALAQGAAVNAGMNGSSADEARRLRALVAESERKQQRELALRVAEVVKDMQTERQADLVKIERSLGIMQNNTGVEVMRQRQLLNSLAVRVSQRQ